MFDRSLTSHLLGDHGYQESTGPEARVDCVQASFDSSECALAIISTAETDRCKVAYATKALIYNSPGQVPGRWQPVLGNSHLAHEDFDVYLS